MFTRLSDISTRSRFCNGGSMKVRKFEARAMNCVAREIGTFTFVRHIEGVGRRKKDRGIRYEARSRGRSSPDTLAF